MDNLNNNFPNTPTPNPVNSNSASSNNSQYPSNSFGDTSNNMTATPSAVDQSTVDALSGDPWEIKPEDDIFSTSAGNVSSSSNSNAVGQDDGSLNAINPIQQGSNDVTQNSTNQTYSSTLGTQPTATNSDQQSYSSNDMFSSGPQGTPSMSQLSSDGLQSWDFNNVKTPSNDTIQNNNSSASSSTVGSDLNSTVPVWGNSSSQINTTNDSSSQVIDNGGVSLTNSMPSMAINSDVIQPSIGNIPPVEATPVDGFSQASTFAQNSNQLSSDAISTLGPIGSTPASPASDTFTSPSPIEESSANTKNSGQAFNANMPDTSVSLNEPLPSSVDSSNVESREVVKAFGSTNEDDKESNVVVIVLVVIIVLLLAGIGYFGYQIFFA